MHISRILALQRPKQGDSKFKANFGYIDSQNQKRGEKSTISHPPSEPNTNLTSV